jgi:hypothetical protein
MTNCNIFNSWNKEIGQLPKQQSVRFLFFRHEGSNLALLDHNYVYFRGLLNAWPCQMAKCLMLAMWRGRFVLTGV